MCSQCDKAVSDWGAGSQAAVAMKEALHPPTPEQRKAREDAYLKRIADSIDAEERRDAAPGELAEAVALLREAEWAHGVDGEKVCVCCHDFVHGHGCKLAAFLGRHT